MKIKGSTALVTGASRRIGRALALALAENGCNVAVHYYSNPIEAIETRDRALGFGVDSEAFQADLASADECVNMWRAVVDGFGAAPNIIVNNASAFRRATLSESTNEEFDRTMAVNLRAPMILAQLMAKDLDQDEIGKILNINDRRSVYKSRFVYGVSNQALSGLTRSLAASLAPNIQVNELRLGPILPLDDAASAGSHEMSARTLGPARRMGTLEEVSQAVISIIGNDYISGASLAVDGGLSALD